MTIRESNVTPFNILCKKRDTVNDTGDTPEYHRYDRLATIYFNRTLIEHRLTQRRIRSRIFPRPVV